MFEQMLAKMQDSLAKVELIRAKLAATIPADQAAQLQVVNDTLNAKLTELVG